jgi:molybdenum cofactor cytidylyltransferase
MPFILPSTVEQVLAAVSEDGISVPVMNGEYGHPVGFGSSVWTGIDGVIG